MSFLIRGKYNKKITFSLKIFFLKFQSPVREIQTRLEQGRPREHTELQEESR